MLNASRLTPELEKTTKNSLSNISWIPVRKSLQYREVGKRQKQKPEPRTHAYESSCPFHESTHPFAPPRRGSSNRCIKQSSPPSVFAPLRRDKREQPRRSAAKADRVGQGWVHGSDAFQIEMEASPGRRFTWCPPFGVPDWRSRPGLAAMARPGSNGCIKRNQALKGMA